MYIDTINKGSWRGASYGDKTFSLLDTATGQAFFIHKSTFDFFKKDVESITRDETGRLVMTLKKGE